MDLNNIQHVEQRLQAVWAHVLNLTQVPLDQSFLSVGGDSISAMQVVGQCRKEGMSLGVQDVLRSRSIPQLALAVKDLDTSSIDYEEYFDEDFDLSPIQSLFFKRPNTHGHFNQSFYLRVTRRTTVEEFRSAVEQLVARHSMLRARFSFTEERGWQQRLTNDIAGSHRFRHSTVSSQNEIDTLIEDSQQCFDHVNGPLFAADFFDFDGEQYAFLTGHHLVVDLVTWRLLLEELEEILKGGQLLATALPFQKWAELQSEHAESLELDDVLPPVNVPPLDFSYWGIQHQDNTYGNAAHASFELDTTLSSAFLTSCHVAYKTEPVEVLLASLIQSWSEVFTDRPVPAIFNEGHGREPWSSDIDITRTVGWFTALSPILVKPSKTPTDTVRKIKDFKRRIPGKGRPYFARRCLTQDGREHFKTHWPMEILFNYLGQYQQLERADALLQPLGTMAGETGKAGGTSDFGFDTCRWGLFEISAFVFKGHLKVAFTFNRDMQHQSLIQKWISQCQTTISQMISGLEVLQPQPTLSDFPLLSVSEESFYSLLQQLSAQGIKDSDIEDVYPCSSMQEGLLLSQTKDSGFYAAATLNELRSPVGQVSSQTVIDAWRRVVKRHQALRTIFVENAGAKDTLYNQVVLKEIDANIVEFHCNDEAEAIQRIEQQRSTSYSHTRCPNHRFTVCTTQTGKTFCSLEISHAIMDGHSMSMLVQDLQKACEGQLQPTGPPYSDYINWLMKQPQDSSLEFWKSYLGGSEVCSFPMLNDGRPMEKALVSIRMDMTAIRLPDLQNFCNTNGITLSNVFHVAWALTLSCYVGSGDVTFGYLTSARDSEEVPGVEEMAGPIINTLVCRVDLSDGTRCLLDVLQDVQRDYMEAIPHRHIALADVQHSLSLSGASLFNTALSYRRLPQEEEHDGKSLQIVETRPIYDPTEYPVSVNVEVGDDSAAVDLDYWTDYLSAGQAANVADTFARSIENIIVNSKRRISALEHISPKHLQQIQNWNVMPDTIYECVHEKFAAWVKSHPDSPAVCGFNGEFTYKELDQVTNRLAGHLVELGVGPEVFVPTCFDKSVFAIVAMLSVLKAGGAAVPLDATHPTPALQTRLEDAQARLVLTTSERAEKFDGLVSNIIVVDEDLLSSLPAVEGPVCTTVMPHNPCFIIFTSGSTGKPKGVVLEHSAIVTSAECHGTNIGLGFGSRMLQFASYTFDNSLEEMFTTLQRGGCVCVPSEAERVNDLAGVIARLNVNMVDLTPTVAALLSPEEVPTLKRLCLGAEPLTKALVETWTPHMSVVGQYGPSEASINSAFKDFKNGGEATNIGTAVGCVTWVVDPENRNRLMPIGTKGELLLEGPILARGYLNDLEKTQAAFIMDPEWAQADGVTGRRFYCTGDLVQYNSDGEMMYLGRKDSQVKLNGQRIELGEIEHHLRLNLPKDSKSAVELVKFNDANSSKALVAFICLNGGEASANAAIDEMTEELRVTAKQVEVELANELPSYYVPSMFMPVTSMPMTTSGKLDRKILRRLAAEVEEFKLTPYRLAGKSGRVPSGHAEVTLSQLWASVLKLSADAVGAEDSFFRLGGDSISAMRLVTAARKEGVVLSVANVFAQPKLMDMAASAIVLSSDEISDEPEKPMVPFELISDDTKQDVMNMVQSECGISTDLVENMYPCSKLQEGLIMLSSKDPGTYVVQPIYRLPADIDLERFKETWKAVFASESVLRTRILYTEKHGFVQVVMREGLEWQSFPRLKEATTEFTRRLPAKNGAPLTTFAIIGEGTEKPYFVWTAHHAVYDGWSWATLFRKVEEIYRSPTQSVPAPVPYSKFVKYLSKLDQKESDDYWITTLDNMTAAQFPQLPSPNHRVSANGQLLHRVPLTRDPRIEVTIPSMIRAAWGLLLATYSGSDDVLWGETNSGREAMVDGIESIIGPTITTAPVRLHLNRKLTTHEYLKEVQRQSSKSVPYQFAGLQHIRKLSSETAVACDFQSFLGIEGAGDQLDPDGGMWHMESANTIGTDFFSYALIFNAKVETDSIHIEALFDDRVIETWLVQRMITQFEFIMKQFSNVQLLDQALQEACLLNPADQQTIASWNENPVDLVQRCIHDVIKEDQVAVRPEAAAVDAWDTGVMSYRELDERSTRLAQYLTFMGVGPGQFVPLCFDKSGWTIIAILAVLKKGAAFVPLDFEAPILRLREIVGDVKARLILCAEKCKERCESIPCKSVIVDRELTERDTRSSPPLADVDCNTPAYAFYTSGSTGKPKGAVNNHAHWVTSSNSFSPGWNITPSARVLQFASYTFDACLIEIFSTLMCGGTVCVPDQESRTNDLVGVVNKFNVNWAAITPSVIRTMDPSQVPQLKTLFLVGEAMSQNDLQTWADKVTLGNGYGPTECACVATCNIMTPSTKPNNLGKVVTSRGWIVSSKDHHELAPVGAVGELLLEGGSVGAGYLNNPERTLEAFPVEAKWAKSGFTEFSAIPLRMYKTGDLVKYNEDGTMLYLGRKDFQTKVRGQRLELSEVEHHLMEDTQVQNALALVPTLGPCAKRLVGIISIQKAPVPVNRELQLLPKEVSSASISAIRDRLIERLPAYMIPSLWISITKFPVMPSGKMDRRRVTQWTEQMNTDMYREVSAVGTESTTTDANEVERKIQAIFANVLNLPSEDIHLNQSFLHLGGDSIAAMQVSSQCRAHGFAISVQDIIRAKSIAVLASLVDESAKPKDMQASTKEHYLPFDVSPIQKLFFDAVGDEFNYFNQTEIFRVSRTFDTAEIEQALTTLVATHPMLRGRFARADTGRWQQRIEKNVENSFRLRQHKVQSADDATLRPIIDESQATLDIIDGPTFSIDVFNISDTFSQVIAIVAHHLVIDVVSWGIILEDLQGLLNGATPSPQSLPYYAWLEQQSTLTKKHNAKNVFPVSDVVPADYAYWGMDERPNIHKDVVEETVKLGARDTMLLLGAQDALSTEILDILVAALIESFHKVFPDRKAITIHNEGHGREPFDVSQDLSRTVGWFSTLAPISLPPSLDSETDIISTIQWVKSLRDRTPGKGRPYFAYRTLTQDGQTRFQSHWPAEAIFNYVGRIQGGGNSKALLQPLENVDSAEVGDNVPRLALFDITAAVEKGAIRVSFSWNQHMERQDQIRAWVNGCRQTLVNAIDDLLSVQSGPSLNNFKQLSPIYNGTSRLATVLPPGHNIEDVEDVYPTSPMQHGILVTQSRQPDLYTYHSIFEVKPARAGQTINVQKLSDAWQTVVHRHPALRTMFVESLAKNGTNDQIVFKSKPGRVQLHDNVPDSEVVQSLRAQAAINCQDSVPPHHLTISKTTSGRLWVKLELSHSINDGTSIANILSDLASAYDAKITRADRGPLYSDYIAHINSGSTDDDLAYWKTYLSGLEPCFFPTLNDGKSGAHEPGSIDIELPGAADVQKFCKANSVTLSNVLQLTWALTLHYFVGSSDVSFGLLASGRDVPVKGIDEAVGCFVNMLIARVVVSDETTIKSLLQSLQTASIDALSHQTCPLADIQHELQLPSLFNTAFTFQRRQMSSDPEDTSLVFDNMEAEDPGEYAVTVNADVDEHSMTVDFGYWKDKICPEQAHNMADTFQKIFHGIINSTGDDFTVGKLDLLTQDSLNQILAWNSDLPQPIRRCVHEVIHDQALSRPRTIKAVEGWDGTFSYQEFDKLTDQLGAHLQSLGVPTETFVPILFDKSSWAIVSMIAIMKAGGAYVPLDPKHPQTRLQELITDVEAKVVLCSRGHHEKASKVATTAVIIDQRSMKKLPTPPGSKPKPSSTPDNAAYCLFTSGTTGKPKGTIIPHQAFCTSAAAFTRRMNINSTSRTFQFASYTFDASCIEILSALTVGATVCVPSEQDRMNNPAGSIRKLKANWSLLTPSVLGTLEPERVSSLKTLVSGGEALPGPILKKWGSHACFINAYGPTEASVVAATAYKSTLDHKLIQTEPGTIGHASGCRLWVTHPRNHDKLMPVGSVGELIVEGPTLARGYLKDEAKTTKAFIANPTWASDLTSSKSLSETARMYKTGDLVRYNTDGSVSYIGRKDTQIKLNGQRIELGEIEFHVGKNFPDNVQSAVELVTPSSRSTAKALAVFFAIVKDQSNEEAPADTDDLLLPMNGKLRDLCKANENGLGGSLPSYMIPSIFIPVSKMPWTSAGKLDRNRLRNLVTALDRDAMAAYRLTSMMNKKMPSTTEEKKIHKAVCAVLNLPASSVGIDDSFVRLGGDSISAMKLVSSAQAENMELSFVDIFKSPKLSDLAAIGARTKKAPAEQIIKPFELLQSTLKKSEVVDEVAQQCQLPAKSILDVYPTSPLQEALFALSIRQSGAYVAQHILSLPTSINIEKFKEAWNKTVQDTDILRTRVVQVKSGEILQAVLEYSPIGWKHSTSLAAAEEETSKIPSHMGGELASYTLVLTATGQRYFVWTLHHSLYDGWSIHLMLQRAQQHYGIGKAQIPQAPYTRFVKYLVNSNAKLSEKYWKQNLSATTAFQYPPKPRSLTEGAPQGQTVRHNVKLAPSQHLDVTPPNLVRAAWALLLAAYTGSDDVVFGETLAGRDIGVAGVTEICGPTLTTVPTRVKIDRGTTVSTLIKRIADNMTERIPHQHYGLSQMKRLGEDMAAACNFQNLLVVQTDSEDLSESMWSVYEDGELANFFTYPLVLEVKIGQTTMELQAHHDSRIVSSWEVERLFYQFETIFQQLSTVGQVKDIHVFSTQDQSLLQTWNTQEPTVVDDTIPSLFFKQVSSQPQAIAVDAFDGKLTYADLRDLASRLAQYLISLGAGPERLIPLCMDKSRWTIVAMMGILISGAAYVPVSPEYPESRLRQIIDSCEASIVLCTPKYAPRFTNLVDEVLSIGGQMVQQLPPCALPVGLKAKSNNACYVIFTSGSTGVPKGVVVEHKSIASSSAAICQGLHMTPSSRVFQFCSYLFDVSVCETLTVLTCGATICVPSDVQRTTNLASAITTLNADWAFLTPSVASTLDGPEAIPTVKTLVVGGEPVTPEVIDKFASGLQLENGYGPTEATVFAVTNDQVSTQRDSSNIGYILRSGRAWITSAKNPHELAPIGAIGELCIQGPLLAREYLKDPEKTAGAFIANPAFLKDLSGTAEARIYRTGDLVRYGADGSIHYIGRRDNQVKVAGQRIELGEIEHHLQTDETVHQVVVQLPDSGPCQKKLVAILNLDKPKDLTAQPWNTLQSEPDLLAKLNKAKDRLSDLVPAYFMPSIWIPVFAIPTLESAKLDKKQVGAWVNAMDPATYQRILDLETCEEVDKPVVPVLEVLQQVWAKVLNTSIENVKPNRSWMSLGGDSITVMHLLAKCRHEGINLTLNQVLRAKSLAQLAQSVGSIAAAEYEAIEPGRQFDLSPIQAFHFQNNDLEPKAQFNQSSTLRFSRKYDSPAVKRALDVIVKTHSMLRARFVKANDQSWKQQISANISDSYAFNVHTVPRMGACVDAISATQKALDIVNGPVFAADLFDVDNDEPILFLAAHHLVIDVVSWGIILEDLEMLLTSTTSPKLQPELPFQTWCEKQAANTLEEPRMNAMKRQTIDVEPTNLTFWGMDGRKNIYGDVERDEILMDKDVSSMALHNHEALGTNIVDILVSAIIHSFSRIFISRAPPTVFNESHGREVWDRSELDLSRTVGWFTALSPITVPISEEEDDVVHTVRQVKDLRRRFPDNGRHYMAHRFLTSDGKQYFANHAPIEVLFNYLGRQQGQESDGAFFESVSFDEHEDEKTADVGENTARMALFEISAAIVQGRIEMSFMYNRWMKNQKGIRRWIKECQQTLREIVAEISRLQATQLTLSDFPLLPLDSYNRLDLVLKSLSAVGITSHEDVQEIYPCSAIQSGMILSQIKDPESYWSSTCFELRTKSHRIDAARVTDAWGKVVNRHPALRTVFIDSVCKGGVFDQIVLKHVDAGVVNYTCDDYEVQAKLNSIRYLDINGKKKPSLPHQAAVVTTKSGRVVVKIIVNHAVIDGGSLSILGNDLQAAYLGQLTTEEGPRYSNYIKYLQGIPIKESVAYWKQKLTGLRPCYFPTTAETSARARQLRFLDMKFTRYADVHTLAEQNNVTFANILLAAWALVLRTYTGSSDVCYGYLTSGRNVPVEGVEIAVGAFINMLVSRISTTLTTTLLDVVQKVQTNFIESMPHQHCSLAQFQHDLGLSGKALFNTAVSIQNRAQEENPGSQEEDLIFEQLEGQDPSEFVMTVNIDATRNDEVVRFTYWTDAISDGEAKNVSTLMTKVISQILGNHGQTIGELDTIIKPKQPETPKTHLTLPKPRPSILRSRSSTSNSSTSPPRTPRITFPDIAPSPSPQPPAAAPDWSNLIRSIVSEMVPQIVEQIVAKNQLETGPSSAAVDQMADQMSGMLARRASVSHSRGRPSLKRAPSAHGSIRSRRMSVASDAESRIQTAADMVAAVGVMATEASKGGAPDFVEKKLLTLWSELLEMVEDTIDQDDSFFQLGGDSIIAMRLVGAAREEGLSMTVADVFKNPTFADMARVVRVAGEVIDEVMSRAGGESLLSKDPGGPSRAAGRRNSLWDDFQSVISEYKNDDVKTVDSSTPMPETDQGKKQQTPFKQNWQGFGTSPPAVRPTSQRRGSTRSMIPHTIQEEANNTPKTVSLLGDPNVDSVISKVQVFKGGISDVLPVTDFQALAITGTLFEAKWMLNYFYLDGEGPLDLRKLKQSAFRMVQAFDILRTVFVPYGDRFLQVVLRKLQPDFNYIPTDDDLDTFTDKLRQGDRDHGPRLGEAFIQFTVAKQKTTGRYRIFMRLSHAQYDGVCVHKILGALQDGYNGLAVSSAPSFGNFVRESAKTVAGAHDHWREILRGSKMTEIVNRFGPNYQRAAGRTVTLEKQVTAPSLSRLNITGATIVKAAWAAALARIAGKSDIVFGHVISGRASGIANVENIVGPCLNMVPVRVVYRPEWSVHDLLSYIQDQQISNMPYESLGFREITRHCTDWPDWTNFSSVLQHDQNIQSEDPTMQLGGIEFKIGAVGSQEDFADFSIHSTSKGGNQMEVSLTFAPNSTITREYAEHVFDMLCNNIVMFSEDPQQLLPSPSELSSQSSTTTNSDKLRRKSTEKQVASLPTDTGLSRHEVNTLATTLRSAWNQILRDEHGSPLLLDLSSDFFQMGGDIMGLAQVASILDQEEGFRVRVEDLIDKSVFVDQVSVLVDERKKQLEVDKQNPWGEKGKEKEKARKQSEDKLKLKKTNSGFSKLTKKLTFTRRDSARS